MLEEALTFIFHTEGQADQSSGTAHADNDARCLDEARGLHQEMQGLAAQMDEAFAQACSEDKVATPCAAAMKAPPLASCATMLSTSDTSQPMMDSRVTRLRLVPDPPSFISSPHPTLSPSRGDYTPSCSQPPKHDGSCCSRSRMWRQAVSEGHWSARLIPRARKCGVVGERS